MAMAVLSISSCGKPAPDFTLPGVNCQPITLSLYRGQVVVLDFWASWCGDCRREMPEVVNLYEEYKDKAKFIGVSFDRELAALQNCLIVSSIKWPQLWENGKAWKESQIAKDYEIGWIPTFIVIDKKGNIVGRCETADELGKLLKKYAK